LKGIISSGLFNLPTGVLSKDIFSKNYG